MMRKLVGSLASVVMFSLLAAASACAPGNTGGGTPAAQPMGEAMSAAEARSRGLALATFAGGCFWCMEPPFDALDGVLSTTSGFMGGEERNPTYQQVASGATGHAEVVQVLYDPETVDYQRLLFVFWRNIDPTTADRQFCDRGAQYRPAVFFHDAEQRRLAEESKQELEQQGLFPSPIVTEITAAGDFWPAEEYHQGYYRKNPSRYRAYRRRCGRDARLGELWGKEAGGLQEDRR